MDANKVYLGDCLEIMGKLQDGSVDMVLCDMPQGITQNKWDVLIPLNDYVLVNGVAVGFTEWMMKAYQRGVVRSRAKSWWEENKRPGVWTHLLRITKENAAIVLFANGQFTADLMQSQKNIWRYNLIWEKSHPTGFLNANRMPLRKHEDICVFYKKLPHYEPQLSHKKPNHSFKNGSKRVTSNYGNYATDILPRRIPEDMGYPTSVWRFPVSARNNILHPTQKPVALLECLIRTYTGIGDVVLDFTAGSCSTGVACRNTGRNYILIEKERQYYDIGVEWVANENN